MTNEELVKAGYRVISRKFKHVSRVDREDWRTVMAKHHAPWGVDGRGLSWVNALPAGSAEDYYRRCLSKDVLIVGDITGIPNSGHAVTGFVK